MRGRHTIAILGAVGLWLGTCSTANAQISSDAGSPALGLQVPPTPEFGGRPSGVGFRPAFSKGRPVLARTPGLQDAMRAARSSPLERQLLAAPLAQPTTNQLNQAITALRSLQEARGQQIAGRASRPSPGAPALAHLTRIVLPSPPALDAVAASARMQEQLRARGPLPRGLTVRRDGPRIVLEGQVASERERRVLERLLRLEPGVYDVENRLEVVGAPGPAGRCLLSSRHDDLDRARR